MIDAAAAAPQAPEVHHPAAFAAYRGLEANDPELAHIHPLAPSTAAGRCRGSGARSTLFAAHQLGRCGRLVELSPSFCDVIARRALDLGLEVVVDRAGVGRIPWGGDAAA